MGRPARVRKEQLTSGSYEFVKDTLCNGEDSGCVEVATNVVDAPGGMAAVRDTKTGDLLEFKCHKWEGFTKRVKNDEVDI